MKTFGIYILFGICYDWELFIVIVIDLKGKVIWFSLNFIIVVALSV